MYINAHNIVHETLFECNILSYLVLVPPIGKRCFLACNCNYKRIEHSSILRLIIPVQSTYCQHLIIDYQNVVWAKKLPIFNKLNCYNVNGDNWWKNSISRSIFCVRVHVSVCLCVRGGGITQIRRLALSSLYCQNREQAKRKKNRIWSQMTSTMARYISLNR